MGRNGESLLFHAMFEENFEATRMVSGWLICDLACSINHLTLMRKLRKTMAKMNEITEVTRFGSHFCRNCFVSVRAGVNFRGLPLGKKKTGD
ncbi:hypothetical protein CEXT_51281 [Caerostris extrusa]|uniref:Uncharacterized protein n=1 Tax=Caerostris extrusa TaxID=172846 RepID=A0AAV4W3A0_CAEEX|nr:hypothetical protein CEXT_51281 [Caerostris extrusa]